jgi:hypothetical protein
MPSGFSGRYLIFLLLTGCATQPVPQLVLSADSLPEVAAQFRTTYSTSMAAGRRQDSTVEWRLWRQPNHIITENLSMHVGEIWQRDGEATFVRRLFHDDRRAIEYQTDDLQLNSELGSWQHRSLLIDPELLSQLQLRAAGWRHGYPYRRYAGEFAGATWDVTIRIDMALPVSMSRVQNGMRQSTELIAVTRLASAFWSPSSGTDYEVIEFADFGDRQADPFVVNVQEQLGKPHRH